MVILFLSDLYNSYCSHLFYHLEWLYTEERDVLDDCVEIAGRLRKVFTRKPRATRIATGHYTLYYNDKCTYHRLLWFMIISQ